MTSFVSLSLSPPSQFSPELECPGQIFRTVQGRPGDTNTRSLVSCESTGRRQRHLSRGRGNFVLFLHLLAFSSIVISNRQKAVIDCPRLGPLSDPLKTFPLTKGDVTLRLATTAFADASTDRLRRGFGDVQVAFGLRKFN